MCFLKSFFCQIQLYELKKNIICLNETPIEQLNFQLIFSTLYLTWQSKGNNRSVLADRKVANFDNDWQADIRDVSRQRYVWKVGFLDMNISHANFVNILIIVIILMILMDGLFCNSKLCSSYGDEYEG